MSYNPIVIVPGERVNIPEIIERLNEVMLDNYRLEKRVNLIERELISFFIPKGIDSRIGSLSV